MVYLAPALLKTKMWQQGWASVLTRDALSSSKEGVLGRPANCKVRQNLHGDVRFLPGCRQGYKQTNGRAAIDSVGLRVEAENAGRVANTHRQSEIANDRR